ncbi:MAG: hypothetical protein M1459_02520 [Patescibacteria group bacterium]|nr:hypothetical protein [Patescibacteria group bacterium]
MEKQHLPTYKHDFLNEKKWLTKESEHYVFHYFPNSQGETDIDMIVRTQEAAYSKIIAFMEVEPPTKKIQYYFYPDEATKTSLMGDDWYAQSIRDEFTVHVLYTKEIKPLGEHEDTHLLSLPWGISIGFFQEGLAEFMVGHAWDGKSHISYVKDGYKQNLYPPLPDFFEHEAWLRTDDSKPLYFYSLVGAFTAFLINKSGKDKFKELYMKMRRDVSKNKNQKAFEDIYGPVLEIEKKFKASL